MKLNIIKKEDKPLLSRTEITAEIEFDKATPSKEEIKERLASSLKSDSKLIVVKQVDTAFGQKQAKVSAFLYKDEKELKRIEPEPKQKKEAKEKPKKEEKKQAPKEETPKKKEPKEKPKETKKEEKPKKDKK